MRWLIFLSRVAFLSGCFMLLAFSLLFTTGSTSDSITSTIILAGHGLAIILLPMTGLLYLITAIAGRQPTRHVAAWMLLANIFFLIVLLIFTFYINDPYYNK